MSYFSFMITSLTLMLLSPGVLAHARFKVTGVLKPRTIESGLKTPPCGGASVDETRRVSLVKGQTIKVEWEETINHPGLFKISFSQDGVTGFETNLIKEVQDDQNGAITYADPSSWHQFSTELLVPNVVCDKCAFQLIQVMTDSNPPTMYYSCADVSISEPIAPPPTETAIKTETQVSKTTNPPSPPTNLEIVVHRQISETKQISDETSANDDDHTIEHGRHEAP